MVRSKKIWAIPLIMIMLFTIIFAIFSIQPFSSPVDQSCSLTSNVSDMQMADQKNVLSFLKHMVGVDVDKYTVNVTHYNSEPDPHFEETDQYRFVRDIIFNLDSEESRLSVSASIQKKRQ
ncbi:MAG: hypothetical protein FWC33_02775 [Candidatus Bathyarchaeota archaeon]|nr:hypothetical protein [Candidatus Termiticorpusculum sp.]